MMTEFKAQWLPDIWRVLEPNFELVARQLRWHVRQLPDLGSQPSCRSGRLYRWAGETPCRGATVRRSGCAEERLCNPARLRNRGDGLQDGTGQVGPAHEKVRQVRVGDVVLERIPVHPNRHEAARQRHPGRRR